MIYALQLSVYNLQTWLRVLQVCFSSAPTLHWCCPYDCDNNFYERPVSEFHCDSLIRVKYLGLTMQQAIEDCFYLWHEHGN